MEVPEAMVLSLPIPEQIFILVNEERIDRGLPAVSNMTSQLNADAQAGADSSTDPGFPASLNGAGAVTWGGSIWAGGLSNMFEADYFWMYSDGWGGLVGTTNVACGVLTPGGCWGHRDNILHEFGACGTQAPTLSMGAASDPNGFKGGSVAAVIIGTCGATPSDVTMTWSQVLQSIATLQVVGMATIPNGQGYWEVGSNGDVHAFGQAHDFGSTQGQILNSPIVGIASTPNGGGYWLVASDGGIFSFGDATFYGSTGALRLAAPIVAIATTSNGRGYWMVAADGGIFAFGDAPFLGSMGGKRLNQPIVGMAADAATNGYWLVASDGGIFSFGTPFFGSTGSLHLVKPIIGMASLPNGQGYRFTASDGGIFDFGTADFDGSLGGQNLSAPVAGMADDLANGGYWLVTSMGEIFGFGGAGIMGG
jgi:hypothetical protein